MTIDLKALSKSDFEEHLRAVLAEHQRRKALPFVEQAQADVVHGLQDAGVVPRPAAWEDADNLPETLEDIPPWETPGTDVAKAYRRGDVVRHDDRIWLSVHQLNASEPGKCHLEEVCWHDITPPPPENLQVEPDPPTDHPLIDEAHQEEPEPPAQAPSTQ